MTQDRVELDGGQRNIYLAARYSRRVELLGYAIQLEYLDPDDIEKGQA